MTLRPFESLRVAPSEVEGRLASTAALRATADKSLAHLSTLLKVTLSLSKGQGRFRLRRFAATARQVVATGVVVMIGGSSTVLACPVCFGAEETSMIDGARLGVLVMLAITLAVQGGFVGFFLYLRKRAQRIADIELDTEWSELQGAPRT